MSRSKGKRYDEEPKLNIKKVIAVIIAILVIAMFVIGLRELLKDQDNIKGKTFITAYYPIYENGKWGVIDTKENIIIEPTYDEMIIIPDNSKPIFICTINTNYETGTFETKVLNESKKELYTNYEKVEVLYNNDKQNNLWYETGMLKVQKDGKYGLIDLNGKELAKPMYDEIKVLPGIKNVVISVTNKKQGIINNIGAQIVPNEYEEIRSLGEKYENGFIVKNENGKYGILSSNGQVIIEAKYDEIKNIYGNNMYVVKEGQTLKIIDKEKTYLENAFEDVKEINLNNIIALKNGKYGIIETNGEVKIDYIYEDLKYAYTDTYIAKKEGKYGIININGEEKLPFEYSYISYIEEANCINAQKENSQTQIFDKELNKKAEGILSEINTDKNFIKMRIGDNYKYYDFKLEEKENIEILTSNTIFLSKKDGKYGYINEKGIVVVDYIYDDATEQNKYGYAGVKKDGKWGAIDQNGKVILEPSYTLENNLVVDFIGTYHLAEDINANYYTK